MRNHAENVGTRHGLGHASRSRDRRRTAVSASGRCELRSRFIAPGGGDSGVGSEREVRNIPILLISIIYPIFHLVNRRERC